MHSFIFLHLWLPSTAISSSVYSFHHLSWLWRPLIGHEGLLVVVQLPSCLWLCHPMDWSMPGLPGPHRLPKFAQVHVHCISDVTQSSPDPSFSFCPPSFPASGTFPVSQLFTSDDQTTGASASASVLPVSSQGWFPLRLTGLISLLSKQRIERM